MFNFTLSLLPPYIRVTPKVLRPFIKAGKVDEAFRPRVLRDGFFATQTGFGICFQLEGVDTEGLDRTTLNHFSKQIAIANRVLPEECMVFEYLVVLPADAPAERPIDNALVSQIANERRAFLQETAKFKNVRLVITLYIPGTIAEDAADFAERSRRAVKQIQAAALLYERQFAMARISRLTPDQLVQFYSYILNLDRSLITQVAARGGNPTKKLGRVHIGVDGDYLRVGKSYCQMLSLVEPPKGTRPNLWGSGLMTIDCPMIWCSVWQRQPASKTRGTATAVENALGFAIEDIYSATMNGYNPHLPPPRRATTIAQESKVEKVGSVLIDLDGRHCYGHWSLFGIIHSRDKAQIESALPYIQHTFRDPAEAGLLEEHRGSLSAFLSCFPGQQYNVRRIWLRGDHKADLSFAFAPFPGYQWSEDLQDEYTMVYETRQGTPFYWSPFINGNGNTTMLGAPGRGKSLNANAMFTAALKHGTKTFIFDQGGSYESNVKALGGSVTYLGLDYPRLNLFAAEGTKDDIFAASHTVKLMLTKSGVEIGVADHDAIEKAVESLFSAPRELRCLQNLVLPFNLLPGLKRWIEGGIYGAIFDNVEDDLQFHDLQLFDFASLGDKHNDLLEVQMGWILMLCQNIIRDKRNLGTPKHIVMDELWKRMGLLPVLKFVLETIKADRKNLAWATLVTQSLADLGAHAQLIKDACPNTIFLGGPFDREVYRTHFRLNNKELDELEGLGQRELAIKVDGEPFVSGGEGYFKVLKMNMDKFAYSRATTKPSERAMRDRLVAEHGQEEGMKEMQKLIAIDSKPIEKRKVI